MMFPRHGRAKSPQGAKIRQADIRVSWMYWLLEMVMLKTSEIVCSKLQSTSTKYCVANFKNQVRLRQQKPLPFFSQSSSSVSFEGLAR